MIGKGIILIIVFLFIYWMVKRVVKRIQKENAMSREVENHINLEDDI
ncbi:MAG: hypothetical protein WC309_04775 [Candidatus Paceibacterota bacterium]